MLKLIVGTALMYLPISLPCGLLCFFFVRWVLQRRNKAVRSITRACLLLCLALLTIGMIYGALRFSGTIMFVDDNTISHNWFNASWRDEGFGYIYKCGVVFAGIATAFLLEGKGQKSQKNAVPS